MEKIVKGKLILPAYLTVNARELIRNVSFFSMLVERNRFSILFANDSIRSFFNEQKAKVSVRPETSFWSIFFSCDNRTTKFSLSLFSYFVVKLVIDWAVDRTMPMKSKYFQFFSFVSKRFFRWIFSASSVFSTFKLERRFSQTLWTAVQTTFEKRRWRQSIRYEIHETNASGFTWWSHVKWKC